jgi:hypothetical protein
LGWLNYDISGLSGCDVSVGVVESTLTLTGKAKGNWIRRDKPHLQFSTVRVADKLNKCSTPFVELRFCYFTDDLMIANVHLERLFVFCKYPERVREEGNSTVDGVWDGGDYLRLPNVKSFVVSFGLGKGGPVGAVRGPDFA